MRVALLADIHGNDLALQAVLNDIESKGGVDSFWILGDLVAIGHAPVQVLDRLQDIPNAHFVRGNTDRYICKGDRPGPTDEDVIENPALLKQRIEVEGDFCWTQGAVTAAGWLDWLSDLPLEFGTTLPDGSQVLCVHASPNQDSGSGIQQQMGEGEIEALLAGCEAELICVGHTHRPFSLQVKGKRIVNPGSVSNPFGPDVRACYAIIDADKDGYTVEFFRVGYNNQEVIEIVEQIRHPARRFIIEHMLGKLTW